MSDSPLASYTAISPNSNPRVYPVTKITPHHMAGNLTVEQCGAVFSSSARQASSNYGIGSDGRIGLYVPEDRRSWASSDWDNDQRAVTIEVADEVVGEPWRVSDAAWESLVDLCADICERNGIPELVYTGDASGNLTEHRMFASTACPGTYLHGRMPELAEAVNARLRGEETEEKEIDMTGVILANVDTGVWSLWTPMGGTVGLANLDEAELLKKAGCPVVECGDSMRWQDRAADITARAQAPWEAKIAALEGAVQGLASAVGADPDEIAKTVSDAVAAKLEEIELDVKVGGSD